MYEVSFMNSFSLVRKIVVAAALAIAPAASYAGIFISVGFAPPALPVYVQPVCPTPGYLWNPGYWAYSDAGYYWVPGVWVQPPSYGVLWTPPYWGFAGGVYGFHAGYWGPHVGFYGGVNYGFGYGGAGFGGGRWVGNSFSYNTAVVNVNVANFHNTYVDRTVINNTTVYNHTSFNGGPGGIQARPSAQEAAFGRENHIAPTAMQENHVQAAHAEPSNFARANGGHPQNAAFQSVGSRQGIVAARGANQQQRIAQGVHSGQMTAGETRNVEGREASINRQAATDRAANGGHLTQQEHQQVNQRQNNVSKSINNDKHNANTQEHPHAEAHEPKR
jgi:hypothetical protein